MVYNIFRLISVYTINNHKQIINKTNILLSLMRLQNLNLKM